MKRRSFLKALPFVGLAATQAETVAANDDDDLVLPDDRIVPAFWSDGRRLTHEEWADFARDNT